MRCEEVCRLVSDADGRVLRGRRVRAHLRECSSCSAFAAMIPSRSADLRALAPPLPAIAAAGLLSRMIGGSSAAGGGSGAGMGGGAGIALSGKTATAGLLTKALAGVVVVSGATVGITSAVQHHSAIRHQAVPATSVVQHTTAGTAAPPALGHGSSQLPGIPSASHRTNAAAAAGFGQQTSEAARSAIHGSSGLAPRGSTVGRPVATTGQPAVVTHPITPSTNAGTHGTGSSIGSTVSSTKSQQGQTQSQVGQTQTLQHTSTTPTEAPLHQSAHATTQTPAAGLLNHVAHLIG